MLFQGCQVLSPNEIEQILSAALEALAKEGCSFDILDPEIKASLENAGATIAKNGRVKIPKDVMLDMLSELQQAYTPNTNIPQLIMGQAAMIHDPILRQPRPGIWEDCQKILHLALELPHIKGITWGIDPSDVVIASRISQLEKIILDLPNLTKSVEISKMASTTQPINFSKQNSFQSQSSQRIQLKEVYLGDISDENLAILITNISEKNKERLQFFGSVRPYHFFQYSFSELKKIQLYSQIQQPIYLQSNYHPTLGIQLSAALTLHIAETLAAIYYAMSIGSTSPLVLVTASPQENLPENDVSNVWEYIRYNLALIQLGHYLGLQVAISGLNKPTPNFIHSSIMIAARILSWIAGVDQITEVGSISKTVFHPLYLVLENEWLEYWQQIHTEFSTSIAIETLLQQIQQGKFPDATKLWKSEIFCYDESELWRKRRTNISQKIRDHFIQRWRDLAV